MEYKSYEPSSNIELDCKKLIKNNKLFPLIAIEGTDCSGKQTQSEMLIKRLQEVGENVFFQKEQQKLTQLLLCITMLQIDIPINMH